MKRTVSLLVGTFTAALVTALLMQHLGTPLHRSRIESFDRQRSRTIDAANADGPIYVTGQVAFHDADGNPVITNGTFVINPLYDHEPQN